MSGIQAIQFNGQTLLKGMQWDMAGPWVVDKEGIRRYVMPGDWIVGDVEKPDEVLMDVQFREKYSVTVIIKQKTMSDVTQGIQRELTFGEKAAGINFNPGGHPEVNSIKAKFAAIIDELNDLRNKATSPDAKRYYSKAISYAEDAQMNGVKAATWQY